MQRSLNLKCFHQSQFATFHIWTVLARIVNLKCQCSYGYGKYHVICNIRSRSNFSHGSINHFKIKIRPSHTKCILDIYISDDNAPIDVMFSLRGVGRWAGGGGGCDYPRVFDNFEKFGSIPNCLSNSWGSDCFGCLISRIPRVSLHTPPLEENTDWCIITEAILWSTHNIICFMESFRNYPLATFTPHSQLFV